VTSALDQLLAHRRERWADFHERGRLLAQAYRDGQKDVYYLALCAGISHDRAYKDLAGHGITAGRRGLKITDWGEARYEVGDSVYLGDRESVLGVVTDRMFRAAGAPSWVYGVDWYNERNTQLWYDEQELTDPDPEATDA
jgi:hypothetical protein